MNIDKKKRLERSGWIVGGATDFLELMPEEASFIELKLALAAGDRSVSLDLLVKSLLRIGASPAAIAKWIRRAESNRAK